MVKKKLVQLYLGCHMVAFSQLAVLITDNCITNRGKAENRVEA